MRFDDTLANLVTGLGTSRDKQIYGKFQQTLLSRDDLWNMYTSDWIAGTIIDAPCDDMTREWRSWKAGPRHLSAIETAERQLCVRQVVNKALKQARLYGGSALIIGLGDRDPSLPVNLDRIRQGSIKYLHSFSRWEITAGELDRDPISPTFGEPQYYELYSSSMDQTSATGPVMVRIHPSRVVRFLGIPPLELTWAVDGWGTPTLQRVFDAVRQAAATNANIASLAYEAKIDIIKIPNLTQNVQNPDYRAKLLARLQVAERGKSVNSALLLDSLEEWDQKQLHFSGYPEVIAKFLEIAAGAANMPVTRLLGKSPSGLNSTGEADLRHYYDTLSSRQRVELQPALDRLDQILIRHATGGRGRDIWYEWNPLWQMSEREKSSITLMKSQASQVYGMMGIMSPDAMREAVRNQLIDDGVYPGLEQTLEEHQGEAAAPLILPTAAVNKAGANAHSEPARDPTSEMRDAQPRTLYVSRPVVNGAEIVAWARSQGFRDVMPADTLHVTIAFSRDAVDWFAAGSDDEQVLIPRGGPRAMERFGDAVVLLISSFALTWRWEEFRRIGASWNHDDYQPHITISWNAAGVDLSKVKPYDGPIILGPERFAEIDEDWRSKIS